MELELRLSELREQLQEKERLERKMNAAQQELNFVNEEARKLKEKLVKEKKDVEQLEQLSLLSIWYAFTGAKTEKLNKERDELYKAEYDYNIAHNSQVELNKEIENYHIQLKSLMRLENEYNHLIKEKENLIIESNPDLKTCQDEIIKTQQNMKELQEAIGAGKSLINHLDEVRTSLSKAKGWGTFDILGGGLLADMAKHSNLNKAKDKMNTLKYSVKRFTRELQDVNLAVSLDLNISEFLHFADFFFDGLFVDLTVQSKINNAMRQVDQQINHVNQTMNQLHQKQQEVVQQLTKLTQTKKQLLEKI